MRFVTTLVCLISDQHVPNLLTVKAVRPGHLVLVVTEKMMKNAPWFLSALAEGGRDYSKNYEIAKIEKENSVEEIHNILATLYARRTDDNWILNITGGTKPMSIGAYLFARENGIAALYIVERDQYNAIDLLGGDPVILGGLHVTAAEFLAGHGYGIRNPDALNRLNQQACDLQKLGAVITSQHDNRDLHDCLGKLQDLKVNAEKINRKKWQREGLFLTEDDPVILKNDDLRGCIATAFGLSETGSVLTGHLERPAAEFLTGRWLEYFVFGLLFPLQPACIRGLQNGLSIGLIDGGGDNELDVSFMTERSFCMVECKTGSQRHDPKGDAVLYKMEAVKAGLRALRVRAFLATTSPNIINPVTGMTRDALITRSKVYDFTIINGNILKELARMYLSRDPSLNDRVINLFKLKVPTGTP